MSKKRVAVIGCGRISVMHFYALTLEPRVELVACCDIVRERAVTACEIYGGVQEINAFGKKGIDLWKSCDYQTWSATAFLNMIFEGIAGYSTINGKFNPYLPDGIDYVKLNNFAVGNKRYDLNIKRSGDTVVFETAQRTNK